MMRWYWKLLFVLVGLISLAIVGLGLAIYVALPSPAALREKMFAKAVTVVPTKKPEAPLPADATPMPTDQDLAARQKLEANEKLLVEFLDPSRPLSRACDSLRSIKFPQTGTLSSKEFGERLVTTLKDERVDPRLESLVPVLKYTLSRPKFREIIDRVRTAKAQTMIEEFKSKKDFYFLIADAYTEMKANREEMQSILDQSYLTMMLGRAVEAKPELASDTRVLDDCASIETAMNRFNRVDFASEKKAFSDLLSENGIDPKKIGFDPEYRTNLKIVMDASGLHFTGGWIDAIFEDLAKEHQRLKK